MIPPANQGLFVEETRERGVGPGNNKLRGGRNVLIGNPKFSGFATSRI